MAMPSMAIIASAEERLQIGDGPSHAPIVSKCGEGNTAAVPVRRNVTFVWPSPTIAVRRMNPIAIASSFAV